MKAIFVAYNQAYNEEIIEVLEKNGQRGFTRWEDIEGRGGVDGEPHYGNHAWPMMNHAVLAVVPDTESAAILSDLRQKDKDSPELGLRAFVWNVESAL